MLKETINSSSNSQYKILTFDERNSKMFYLKYKEIQFQNITFGYILELFENSMEQISQSFINKENNLDNLLMEFRIDPKKAKYYLAEPCKIIYIIYHRYKKWRRNEYHIQ